MKHLLIFLGLFAASCNTTTEPSDNKDTSAPKTATTNPPPASGIDDHEHGRDTIDLYRNARFQNVRVKKIGDSTYSVSGKAQMFEATYMWIVEDGHEELLKGYGTTDAGAPEFGNFSFTFNVKKRRPNSKLHLVLFESSPKDGSRQHELPVPLD
jgi:hypothetical protein